MIKKNSNIFDHLPREEWRMKEAYGMMKYINGKKDINISELVVKTKYSRERVKEYLEILKKIGSIEIKETKAKTIILPVTRKSLISQYLEPLKEYVKEMKEVMNWEDGEREIMLAHYIFQGELFLVFVRCMSKVIPGMDIVLKEVEKQWDEDLKKYSLRKKWDEDEFHNVIFSESFIRFGQSILEDFEISGYRVMGSLNTSFGVKV
ncbi:MAG: hypothetical protein IIC67_07190 [Thaumarchaeota archaeon]|nr:hypothetical protein [Nitrososphaerota archaeon]